MQIRRLIPWLVLGAMFVLPLEFLPAVHHLTASSSGGIHSLSYYEY